MIQLWLSSDNDWHKSTQHDYYLDFDTFREFDVWHQSLDILSLDGFRINTLEAFAHFKNMSLLDLSFSDLCEMKADTLKGMEQLKFLILNGNQLKSFEAGTFDCLKKLLMLSITGNKIKSLQPGLFKKLTTLEQLDLDGNPLSVDLHEDTFCGLENLKELNLTDTPLAQVIDQNSPIITKHTRNTVVKLGR